MVFYLSMNSSFPNPLKRVVAMLVILITGVCLVEELFALNSCAEEGGNVDFGSLASVIGRSQGPEQSPPPGSSEGDHDCFCCCRHVIPGAFFHPEQNWSFSFLEPTPNSAVMSAYPSPPYHPPQA
jgi:hypothetical protein